MAILRRLLSEWSNRSQPDYLDESGRKVSMRDLEQELLTLKDTISYQENWKRLATVQYVKHAGNLRYVAALLYLLDERPFPVSDLQPTINLQLGHIYRQLKRAHVVWNANSKGFGARLRQDYLPYSGVLYIDPLSGTLLRAGERSALPPDAQIFRDMDQIGFGEEREEVLGLLEGLDLHAPYPLLKTKPPRAQRPPNFPAWKRS